MSRRSFLFSLAAGLPAVFSLQLIKPWSEKKNEIPDSDESTIPKIKAGFAELTLPVKIKNVRHNVFEPDSPSRKGGEKWVTQNRYENIEISCEGRCIFNDFDIELYFTDRAPLQKILSDLTEDSTWMVSGSFAIIDGKMTLFRPRYRKIRDDEIVNKA